MLVLSRKLGQEVWIDVESYINSLIRERFPGAKTITCQPIVVSVQKLTEFTARLGLECDDRIEIARPEARGVPTHLREKMEQRDAECRRRQIASGRNRD